MKKRLLSILLAFSMVLTFLPTGAVTALATDDITAHGTGYGPAGDLQIDNFGYPYYGLTASEQDIKHDTYDENKKYKGDGWEVQPDRDGITAVLCLLNGEYDFGESKEINCGVHEITTNEIDAQLIVLKSGIFNKQVSNPRRDFDITQSFIIRGGTYTDSIDASAYDMEIYGGTFLGSLNGEYSNGTTLFHAGVSKEKPSRSSSSGLGRIYSGSNFYYFSSNCSNAVYHLTAENCTINGIEGGAYVATCTEAQPTVTVSGASYLKDCEVQLSDGLTESLEAWGAKNIIRANGLVSFTAPKPTENKSTIQEVTLVPETAETKTIQLPDFDGITVKVNNTEVTPLPTNGKLSVPQGASVIITAPALTDTNKKYQWTDNGFKIPEDSRNLFDNGCSYLTVAADNVTIGLEIVDKTPEIPAGDTKSTTLTNAVLKKVVNDGTDITNSITKNAGGSYNIPIRAEVTVAFDKDAFADSGSKFSYWKITGLTQDEANRYNKQESFTFIMPDKAVTLEAMTQDESIDDTTAEILGTAAIIGTAVVGTAVLAYQGHQLGTQFYLTYLLPSGAVIPANRIQLAMLLWQDAGDPAPVDDTLYSDLDADDTDTLQAAQWAVETGLMELPDADNAPDQFDPYAAVSTVEVIHAWKNAQRMKG